MAPGCFERVLHSTIDTLREGGLHGWMAVLGLLTSKMMWVTLVKALGMMLPTLQEQFVASTWIMGWMVAFIDAFGFFAGLLATPLKERFGARTVLTVSGLVAGISMITASFLSSLYAITVVLTLLTGPAMGISYVITKHLIGCYFSKSITTAYSVATLGTSSVFVTFVPLEQLFLDIYGWRGTMLLLGAIFSHNAVCGALIKPPAAGGSQDGYEAAHMDEEQATRDDRVVPNNRFGCSCFTTVYSYARDTFRLGLFSSISFWLVVFVFNVLQMIYSAWMIYYAQYTTVYKEFTLEDTSHFVVAYGVGRIVACVVIGPLVQKVQIVSTYTMLAIALLAVAIYFAVDPWLTNNWPIVANSFVFGNSFAMTSILSDVVVKEVFGKEQMGHALGLMGLVTGITSLLLLFFPGLIYDIVGDYTVAFSLMAGVQSLAAVAVMWLYWRQKRHRSSSESSQ